ncbi:phage antirepressor KilAC domain-containing protein [Ilyobacter polytropus]|uniref:Phage regulatory protein, Rha family n=1 Tax=Ilyobacter polytropus (strain ATCC 51220 / DSM 2926 / LMG 16218 / CuHBu1) TaxID=572544 RepID=E3HBD3_ILYPC|nr:phage regulatory protein/antirepressor Ant [Ilyobacter polytropus]ADO83748.1 phage regulatory protein, Rha family [Ilyobacter polytropus DSM 2926]
MELIKIENNKNYGLVVSSRVVAEELGKEHKNVCRDLEGVLKSVHTHEKLIIPSSYIHPQNKQEYREFLLTKDGFTLYMFNIQGYNDFKLNYINKFNEMERALQETQRVPQTFREALLLAAEQQERLEEQEQKILEMKPKEEFYNEIIESKDTIDIGTVAKVINKGIGRNKLFKILRDRKVLQNNNQPYQEYIDRGYFRCVESRFTKPNGTTSINIKTVVFQKGVDYINKLVCEV